MNEIDSQPVEAVRLEGISKEFSGSESPAVDDVNLSIGQGEFVCLLGPSGCGKTTTLRMIAGLEQPTDGTISSEGQVLSSQRTRKFVPPERRGFGLVFQSYALWPHLTVGENIGFGLRVRRWRQKERQDRVHELSSLLRIENLEDRYPAQLSGGQQQRVALARMLAISPSILLLDEPLSNLDASLRLEMRAELKRLHSQLGNTIVFVTHDQLEAMSMATKIAVMSDGKVQQYAPPMDIYRKPSNRFVAEFVGSPPMSLLHTDGEHASLANDMVSTAVGSPKDAGAHIRTVGVRPESFHLGDALDTADPRYWRAQATVDTILPTGASWLVGVSLKEATFFSQLFSEPRFAPGDSVNVVVDTAEMHLFDEDGVRVSATAGSSHDAITQ